MDPSEYARSILLSQTDFRKFLGDFIAFGRQNKRGFTLGRLSRKLGYKNSSSLLKILSGARRPSKVMVERLCQHLELRSEQRIHLKDLAGRGMSKLAEESRGKKFVLLPIDQFRPLCNILTLTIAEMAGTAGFVADVEWIAARVGPQHTRRQIKTALAFLQEHDFLSGALAASHIELKDAEQEVARKMRIELLDKLNSSFLTTAKTTIKSNPGEIYQSGAVLTLSRAKIKAAIEYMERLHDESVRVLNDAVGDAVYVVSMQLFPTSFPPR